MSGQRAPGCIDFFNFLLSFARILTVGDRSILGSLGPFLSFHFFGQVDNRESKNKYSSIAVYLFSNTVHFFVWFLKRIYMFKVNLKIFWHLAQGILFGGFLGPQFSLHFSIIKTERNVFSKKDDWPKAYAGPRLPTLLFWILIKPIEEKFALINN